MNTEQEGGYKKENRSPRRKSDCCLEWVALHLGTEGWIEVFQMEVEEEEVNSKLKFS